MKVQIINEEGRIIWERGKRGGVTCRGYAEDGTIKEIIRMLQDALKQAEGEGLTFNNVQRVSNVSSGTGR